MVSPKGPAICVPITPSGDSSQLFFLAENSYIIRLNISIVKAYNETVEGPSRRKLWFWWLVFIFFVLTAVWLTAQLVDRQTQPLSKQPGLYRVVRVDDGDTIVVDMNGVKETVRFIGVDTPETHHPKLPVQCYGQKAAAFTGRLLANQSVRLQADSLGTNRDRYDRLLRYVYLPDGQLLDKLLIAEGYGFAYTYFPFEKLLEFKAAELKARLAQRGLWAKCEIINRSGGGHATGPAQLAAP
ncbi:thermonuclease family protein [Candidatus Saccharibacteria bacterium]|nr:thermonuclease family protein [Candidatus Saccharibacteria bacterium]